MSQRVNLTAKFPPGDDENSADYTRRLLSHAREAGTFRQCSIGYHDECSDKYGDECRCSCHAQPIILTRDQLEAWAQRELTDEEVMLIEMAIPESSIPEAIQTISENLD
jgi:hypothetical protein